MKQGIVRIGTSGWSYPSGKGTWNGIFYPGGRGRGRGAGKFDQLAFYAEHFDTVEINSSFYRVPTADTTRDWAKRTPRDFEFSLKLYQKFTHPEMFHKASGKDPWDLGGKDVDEMRRALEPLAAAGKLGALLAQFPASFKNEPDSRAYVEWLLEQFRDYQLAVELRHRTWSDDPVETLAILRAAERRLDANRRAQVQALDPPGSAAERRRLLLPAAARPQRQELVEAREVRGSLQLPLHDRGAGADRRSRTRTRRAR